MGSLRSSVFFNLLPVIAYQVPYPLLCCIWFITLLLSLSFPKICRERSRDGAPVHLQVSCVTSGEGGGGGGREETLCCPNKRTPTVCTCVQLPEPLPLHPPPSLPLTPPTRTLNCLANLKRSQSCCILKLSPSDNQHLNMCTSVLFIEIPMAI